MNYINKRTDLEFNQRKFLIVEKKGNINIFQIIPYKQKILEYRKKEMNNYSNELKLKYLQTNTVEPILKLLKEDQLFDSSISFANYNYQDYCFSTLLMCPIDEYTSQILKELQNKYYNNRFNNNHLCMLFHHKLIEYKSKKIETDHLLITQEYDKNNSQSIKEVRNILSLPEKLYTLELLLRGKYDLLIDRNYEEQLKLFEIEFYTSYSKSQFNTLIELGLINEDKINNTIDCGTKIYKKIRW